MSSQTGRALRVQLFGESHGAAIGATLDGLPAGLKLDMDAIAALLSRRAARGSLSTARRESDIPRIVSGLKDGITTGTPLTALFENADAHSDDYAFLPDTPRPGHADYPAFIKSAGHDELCGGGHHSGRLTLAHTFAGGVAMQLIARAGVRIAARVLSIADVRDTPIDSLKPDMNALEACRLREIPTLDASAGKKMLEVIQKARQSGDSVGGVVEAVAVGLPVGLGEPYFDGAESLIAAQLFSIPAVKGVEFGAGFAAASMRGSEYNDPYTVRGGGIALKRNSAGGLLGGLANGAPIIVRAAFRPTPSIAIEQDTVSLSNRSDEKLTVIGRHDPCVAVRAVPAVEGALALALCELWLEVRGNAPLEAI